MNPILRNIVAVVIGLIGGSLVNMSLIMMSGSIIPPPEGVDVTSMDGLKENMHLFAPKHFIMPFLAHALGALSGGYLAALIAVTHKMTFAFCVGIFFLLGGIVNVFILPSPTWFTLLDLIVAYIPMAWLGGRLALKK
tara:strand:+ start:17702 stop:18112 length:411 start_codon:yes stop_codon:yes gene_type:complete